MYHIILGCYVWTLLGLFFFGSSFLYWVMLELNMTLFILLISDLNLNTRKNICLFYFLIQSLGSFLFLYGVLLDDVFKIIYATTGLTLKLGLFPLYFWVYKISISLTSFNFTILITYQKLFGLYYLFMFFYSYVIIDYLIVSNAIVGCYLIYISKNLKEILISSSIYNSLFFILLYHMNFEILVIFVICYFSFLFLLVRMKLCDRLYYYITFIVFLCRFPPLRPFFIKIFLLSNWFTLMRFSCSVIFWFATFLSSCFYLKFCYSYLNLGPSLYDGFRRSSFTFLIISVFFFFFLFF